MQLLYCRWELLVLQAASLKILLQMMNHTAKTSPARNVCYQFYSFKYVNAQHDNVIVTHFCLQWREATFNTPSSDTQRIYTICHITKEEVKNWLRTPYILRGDAKRLFIEITFTIRSCTKYPDPLLLQQCKESFKLMYYESDSDIANATFPQWSTNVYQYKDVIAADRTFTDRTDYVSNVETRNIAVTKNGIYFAFFDEGGCTTLLSVRIYYVMCESVTVEFATFPNTSTGSDEMPVVPRNGICVSNAAIEKPPKYLCNQNGKWMFMSGGCKCMPGYEPHKGEKECKGKLLYLLVPF